MNIAQLNFAEINISESGNTLSNIIEKSFELRMLAYIYNGNIWYDLYNNVPLPQW